ncbi:MAG: J domain-containing protein, partial [Patulibacter sp.]|nr:J domain-containing protein [Patulibacter sp.]
MNPADAFAVLGLPITASEAEVKAAYRRLVARYHPDTGVDAGPGGEDAMLRINDAYAAARATWHRQASRASKPIYAPPKPPPRAVPEEPAPPAGPAVPPLHEESERVQAAAAEAA